MKGMWVVAVAGVTVMLAMAVGEGAASGGSRGPEAIVSLGDSFISGEGGRWLGNGSDPFGTRSGTDRAAWGCDGWGFCEYEPELVYGVSEWNGCHRSDTAPILSAPVPVPVAEKVNLACSGARAVNLWPAAMGGRSHFAEPPQADALARVARRDAVRMIVVTVGANDVGFGDLVVGCALDWTRSSEEDPIPCRDRVGAGLAAALPSMSSALSRTLTGVQWTMAAAGYRRSGYRLVVMGYASPLPPGRLIRYPEEGWSRLHLGGCPIWDADADWAAAGATGAIVSAMRSVASSAGAEFLDVRHALDGHQLCDRRARRVGPEGPSPRSAEWVRRLDFTQGSVRESLHPNAYGQRALGACIGLLYVSAAGNYACRAEAGRSYVDGIWLEGIG